METEYEYTGPSRSQKKRESTSMQKLGEELVALSPSALQNLGLPAPLVVALTDLKRFPGHEAKRRQMQFIGRLMREELDYEDIAQRLEDLKAPHNAETERFHALEELRDKLVAIVPQKLDGELCALTERFPDAALPRLKHLVTMAQQEREKKSPPKAYRELFRYLKSLQKDTQ